MKQKRASIPTFKSPTTKGVSTKKRASDPPLWKRLGVPISKQENREFLAGKIKSLLEAKGRIGRELIVGFNSASKIIENVFIRFLYCT